MAPGVPVRVHDAYVAGEGRLHPAVFGLFTLTDQRDTGGALAQGELLRFLAEAPWYPTLLLPGPNLRWEPVDDRAARVTLRDGATVVTMTFRFGDDEKMETKGFFSFTDCVRLATAAAGTFASEPYSATCLAMSFTSAASDGKVPSLSLCCDT